MIKQIMAAARDGWEPKDNFESANSCRMWSQNWFSVQLVKDDASAINSLEDTTTVIEDDDEIVADSSQSETTEDDSEKAEELTQIKLGRISEAKTKKELQLLALAFEIEIPDDKKQVNAIKKFLNEEVIG